jgi:BolA protein
VDARKAGSIFPFLRALMTHNRREKPHMNAEPGPVAKRIRQKLEEALSPQTLQVIDESHLHAGHAGSRPGGETHFRVKVVSASFVGKSLIERHRKVNEVLADELKPDGVHALAIEAHAPDE